jgi:ABC-type antimicrobial peptide transport system permease subunit
MNEVKKDIANIGSDLVILGKYQNVDAIGESFDNTQRIVQYTALSILIVILILSAIMFVNMIDKRKYEFAMLKANGLTKHEIRKLVISEMLTQATLVFIVSLLLAWLAIWFLSCFYIEFLVNWSTILWLALISLCSVIPPSIVSLIFVNKYEPDAVMRN